MRYRGKTRDMSFLDLVKILRDHSLGDGEILRI
jgi:hypothetical protein